MCTQSVSRVTSVCFVALRNVCFLLTYLHSNLTGTVIFVTVPREIGNEKNQLKATKAEQLAVSLQSNRVERTDRVDLLVGHTRPWRRSWGVLVSRQPKI